MTATMGAFRFGEVGGAAYQPRRQAASQAKYDAELLNPR